MEEKTYAVALRIIIECATAARSVASKLPDDCCAEAVATALEELVDSMSGSEVE